MSAGNLPFGRVGSRKERMENFMRNRGSIVSRKQVGMPCSMPSCVLRQTGAISVLLMQLQPYQAVRRNSEQACAAMTRDMISSREAHYVMVWLANSSRRGKVAGCAGADGGGGGGVGARGLAHGRRRCASAPDSACAPAMPPRSRLAASPHLASERMHVAMHCQFFSLAQSKHGGA